MDTWLDDELSACSFKDKRLWSRFVAITKALAGGCGRSIPQVCEHWCMTKATYRFLSNNRVDESEILSGHFKQTAARIEATSGPILVLHDTTEFTYKRKHAEAIGFTRKLPNPHKLPSPFDKKLKACGIMMHGSLAITPEGLPLGVTAIKFWSRDVFKGTNQNKLKINPTRVPITEKESTKWLDNLEATHNGSYVEPSRLVHIGDRENDIYEFYCRCVELGSYFMIRCCVNRLANDTTLSEEMSSVGKHYKHTIHFYGKDGESLETTVDIKTKSLTLHAPIGKQSNYDDIEVTFVSAIESNKPKDRDRIRWTFLTNLPVNKKSDVLKLLDWYKQRWKIESYFKIMKSGLKVEESRLRASDRLSRLIAICCILAWRIQWMTLLNREDTKLAPQLVFDKLELRVLNHYYKDAGARPSLQEYICKLAMLGGYLNRETDPPPGSSLIWRGMNRLNDLRAGFQLALDVGN